MNRFGKKLSRLGRKKHFLKLLVENVINQKLNCFKRHRTTIANKYFLSHRLGRILWLTKLVRLDNFLQFSPIDEEWAQRFINNKPLEINNG